MRRSLATSTKKCERVNLYAVKLSIVSFKHVKSSCYRESTQLRQFFIIVYFLFSCVLFTHMGVS